MTRNFGVERPKYFGGPVLKREGGSYTEEPETPFTIGNLFIRHTPGSKVYIRYNPTGEGGEFSAEDLGAVLERFFWEEF